LPLKEVCKLDNHMLFHPKTLNEYYRMINVYVVD
jgi:hypothetical protein